MPPPAPAHKSPLWLSLYKNIVPTSLIWGRDAKVLIGASIPKQQLTQVTEFALRIGSSADTKRLKSWNCPVFAERGSTSKSQVFEALGGFAADWQV